MDTSETYIKMCHKSRGILPVPDGAVYSRAGLGCYKTEAGYELIYLWSQGELQEMVPSQLASTQPNCKMISELTVFHDYWADNGLPNILTSWEQLWLAFVMQEKHGKQWNGNEWQSSKEE